MKPINHIKPVWLETREVLKILNCSRGALSNLQKRNDFPKPIRLSFHSLRWNYKEIKAWSDTQKQARKEMRDATTGN